MAAEAGSGGLIARRLDHLFQTVRPDGRDKPYTHAEVAAAINEAAGEHVTGATYVYQLRTGRSDNPTYKLLVGLARFFGVSPTYFFDEEETGRGALPAEAAAVLRDDDVRDLALEAAGLSEHSRQAIRQMIASARAMEEQAQVARRSPRRSAAGATSRSSSRSRRAELSSSLDTVESCEFYC